MFLLSPGWDNAYWYAGLLLATIHALKHTNLSPPIRLDSYAQEHPRTARLLSAATAP